MHLKNNNLSLIFVFLLIIFFAYMIKISISPYKQGDNIILKNGQTAIILKINDNSTAYIRNNVVSVYHGWGLGRSKFETIKISDIYSLNMVP